MLLNKFLIMLAILMPYKNIISINYKRKFIMSETIKVDTRGMSCSQSSFQAKAAAINNTELNTIIEVLVSGHSSCESVIRGCKKYGYEGTFEHIENEDILVTLKKVR